jgi:hypothetical protein
MKTISLILSLCVIVLASCGRNESDNPEQKWQAAKDSVGMTISITQALQDWRRDSLGCLELRMKVSEAGILDSIKIDSLLYEEVLELLGTPNRSHIEKQWLETEEKEEELLILTYDISSYCSTRNGILSAEPIAWVNISILPRTKRVVKVMGGIT